MRAVHPPEPPHPQILPEAAPSVPLMVPTLVAIRTLYVCAPAPAATRTRATAGTPPTTLDWHDPRFVFVSSAIAANTTPEALTPSPYAVNISHTGRAPTVTATD